jgi:hypothetical protein
VVCKGCEEIVIPRPVFDQKGRTENNQCPNCGAFVGLIVRNHTFHYIGSDDEDNPVYIQQDIQDADDFDADNIPQVGDVEKYL